MQTYGPTNNYNFYLVRSGTVMKSCILSTFKSSVTFLKNYFDDCIALELHKLKSGSLPYPQKVLYSEENGPV